MALERGIPNFLHWLLGSPASSLLVPGTWGFLFGTLAICLLLFFVVPFVCFLVLSLQYGPSEAFYYVARSIFTAVAEDLPRFLPRRAFAVGRVAGGGGGLGKKLGGFWVFLFVVFFC